MPGAAALVCKAADFESLPIAGIQFRCAFPKIPKTGTKYLLTGTNQMV
jgi:hypothetical protein